MEKAAEQVERDQMPVWARPAKPRRPALTRDGIVAAAIEIADAEGLEAVSMRRVAAHLGARTMSLYTHIERKEDLYDLMADTLVGEILLDEGEMSTDWREAISSIARRERHSMRRHRWITELICRRTGIGPQALRHLEQSLQALDPLNVGMVQAMQVVRAVDQFVFGFVSMEVMHFDRPESLAERWYINDLLAGGEFPRVSELVNENLMGGDESFERGLRWLLDGIERDLAPRTDKP